jgi:hypothetical protein
MYPRLHKAVTILKLFVGILFFSHHLIASFPIAILFEKMIWSFIVSSIFFDIFPQSPVFAQAGPGRAAFRWRVSSNFDITSHFRHPARDTIQE